MQLANTWPSKAVHLLFNPDMAKLLLLGVTWLLFKMPDVTVSFLGQKLTPLSHAIVEDLGVILD